MKKIVIALVLVAVAAVVVFLVAKNGGDSDDKLIKMVKVERGDVIEKALAVGRIEPEHEIAVKSKISGIVKKVFVEVGDVVEAGQPLVEILPNPTPLEFAEAKRNVEMATIELDNAEAELRRFSELYKSNLVPARDFENSENTRKQLALRLSMAQERLALIDVGRTKIAGLEIDAVIKSPIRGTVLERRSNDGDPVVPLTSYQAGTELIILADMRNLRFKGTVDEIDVGKIREGMPAELKIGAIPDAKIEGLVDRISPKARRQENSTLFDIEITITGRGDTLLRAGYSANADLVINKSEKTLILPERLVEFKGDKALVEVKDAAGAIVKKEIKTGLSDGITIEILEGLAEGAEVVERPPKEIK
jgi:HlyD family secretion protein